MGSVRSLPAALALVCALLLAAASASAAQSVTPFSLPASFRGATPCGDCGRTNVTLTLRPNRTYTRTEIDSKYPVPEIESGSWRYEPSSDTIALTRSRRAGTIYYRVGSPRVLYLLDANGDTFAEGLRSFPLGRTARVVDP